MFLSKLTVWFYQIVSDAICGVVIWLRFATCRALAFEAMTFNEDSPFMHPSFFLFYMRAIRQHSVEVDPEVSESVRVFYDFSIEGDCWHCVPYCFVVEGVPQGLRHAWIDFGLLVPIWHFFQLPLDSGDCCLDVTGCFVDKPVVRKRKHLA